MNDNKKEVTELKLYQDNINTDTNASSTIESIISIYTPYIYNYALKLTCHPIDAEDITQETFIKAWLKLQTLRKEDAIKKWLRSICYHEFLMKMREKNVPVESLTDELELLEQEGNILATQPAAPDDEVIVAEEIHQLQSGCFYAMVRKLTLNQRIAFSLVDMFGMDIEDVACILETSKGAAKGLLYRARMNLDSFFSDHCDLINEKNPCSCKAWIEFSTNRENIQKETKRLIERLDYRDKQYKFDDKVRSRVKYLYSHMPEAKPSNEWYRKVIDQLK